MTSTCSSRGGCTEASQWSQSVIPIPTIIWSMATTQKSLAAISSTWTRTISMVGPALTHGRLPVRRRLRAAGQNYGRSSSSRSRGLYAPGGPRVPRRASRRAQCISAGTEAHCGSEKVDVGVSAQPPPGLKSWFPTSATRTAMCCTIGICSCTCFWETSDQNPSRPPDGAVHRD